MALIKKFEHRPNEGTRVHDRVTCGYRWFDVDGQRILQLDTYGSSDRMIPGKVSQSIQLDREAADALLGIIEQSFSRYLTDPATGQARQPLRRDGSVHGRFAMAAEPGAPHVQPLTPEVTADSSSV